MSLADPGQCTAVCGQDLQNKLVRQCLCGLPATWVVSFLGRSVSPQVPWPPGGRMDMKMKAHLEFQKMILTWNAFLQMCWCRRLSCKLKENVCPNKKRQLSQARLRCASPSHCWKPPTASPRAQNYEKRMRRLVLGGPSTGTIQIRSKLYKYVLICKISAQQGPRCEALNLALNNRIPIQKEWAASCIFLLCSLRGSCLDVCWASLLELLEIVLNHEPGLSGLRWQIITGDPNISISYSSWSISVLVFKAVYWGAAFRSRPWPSPALKRWDNFADVFSNSAWSDLNVTMSPNRTSWHNNIEQNLAFESFKQLGKQSCIHSRKGIGFRRKNEAKATTKLGGRRSFTTIHKPH